MTDRKPHLFFKKHEARDYKPTSGGGGNDNASILRAPQRLLPHCQDGSLF